MSTTSAYLWAICGLALIGTAGVVALEIFRPDVDRGLLIALFGWLPPTLVSLLALLRGVANGREILRAQSMTLRQSVQQDQIQSAVEHTARVAEEAKSAATRNRP